MAKYRNIPQATKDNILHYVNQVYDEAYELGYQHGRRQGESDIEKTQRMIEDAVESLQELRVDQMAMRWKWLDYLEEGLKWECSECGSKYTTPWHYCPNCGEDMRGDEE